MLIILGTLFINKAEWIMLTKGEIFENIMIITIEVAKRITTFLLW